MSNPRGPIAGAGTAAAVVGLLLVAGIWVLDGYGMVLTRGISMAPHFRTGDLAVVQDQASYQVGDIVAYRSATLQTVVLHRIIRAENGAFTTRGDNNDWDDPDHPTAEQIRGGLVLRVPGVGRVFELVRGPTGLVALSLLPFLGKLPNPRNRRKDKRPVARSTGSSSSNDLTTMASIAGAALVAILVVWIAPTPVPAVASVPTAASAGERLALAYTGSRVATGDPVFLKVVRSLTFTATYTGRPDVLTSLTAEVSHPTGWKRALPLNAASSKPTAAGGLATGTLDLTGVAKLLNGFTAETGLPSAGAIVAVVPHAGDWSPRVEFTFDGVQLQTRPDSLVVARTATGPPGQAVAGTPPVPEGPAVLAPVGRVLPDTPRRVAATVVLTLAAGIAVAVIWAMARRKRVRPGERLRSGRVLEVAAHTPAVGRTVIDLPDVAALAKLAEQEDLPIFETTARDGVHYLLDTGTVAYQAHVPLALGAAPSATPNLPAEVVVRLAHELRTPLAAVLGYAELLADSAPEQLTDAQRNMLHAIDRGATTLRHLVDDVTVLADLETRPAEELTELVDVGALVGAVCEPLTGSLALRHIQLSADVDPSLPLVAGDAEKLSRALDELVTEAVRAGGPGSEISISARHTAGELVLTVSEHGRRGAGTGEPVNGSEPAGIGFTLAQAIAEYHGGDIDLTYEPTGTGQTATLRLPAGAR
jgi:signal peptidase I